MSHPLRQKLSLSGMASVELHPWKESAISLLLPTPSSVHKSCSTRPTIQGKVTLLPSQNASERSLAETLQFWDCPSDDRWPLHHKVDQQAKSHRIPIQYPNNESWELCRRNECEDTTKEWQMFFENAPYRGSQFLDTYDDDDKLVTPTYTKGGSWLTTIGISNSICARATCLITNHAPIGEYRARFHPNKNTSCLCSSTQLETRHHILRQCPLYKGHNCVGYVLSKIVDFLQSNPRAFCFMDSIK